MSVRQFAEFQIGSTAAHQKRSGQWRTQLGNAWHQDLKAKAEQSHENAYFETGVSALWIHKGWTLEIHGRTDQIIIEKESTTIREIKTVSLSLPAQEEELHALYPSYWKQLATYLVLAKTNPAFPYPTDAIRGELVFVDIKEGITQIIPLDAEYQSLFDQQLETLHPYLEQRWDSQERRKKLAFKPAFEVARAGQQEAFDHLSESFTRSKHLLFEAPTGFGKTGTLLQYALERIRDGVFTRLIYLTGKSTGQIQVIQQIRQMLGNSDSLRYFQIRNKMEHANRCSKRHCDARLTCNENLNTVWSGNNGSPWNVLSNGTLDVDEIAAQAAELDICPYELTRAVLPYAEIWVCDYNYVFSPGNQSLLSEQPGFEPENTLLVIDEAHNLPSRVADCYSATHSVRETEAVLAEIQLKPVSMSIVEAWRQWNLFLEHLDTSNQHALETRYEALEYISKITQALSTHYLDYEELSPFAADLLYGSFHIKTILENNTIETLIWSPKASQLRISCLDASNAIESTLNQYGSTLCTSATLSPIDVFVEKLGVSNKEVTPIFASADWRDNAYQVAIDCRVDTRLKSRPRHYLETARTISAFAQTSLAPVAVFFPSYQYAETIKAYLEAEDPLLRIATQPRSIDLSGQMTFIEESLLASHALFFILGSGFSESIDLLGGRVDRAIVIGPALPEVNAVQKSQIARLQSLGQTEAFRRVYQIPAMQKINQALGRLVRAPGQKAQVLLHCRRFADRTYQALLAPEYQESQYIRNTQEFQQWLEASPDL